MPDPGDTTIPFATPPRSLDFADDIPLPTAPTRTKPAPAAAVAPGLSRDRSRKPKSRNRVIAAGAAVVVLGGGLIAALMMNRPTPAPTPPRDNPPVMASPTNPGVYTREMLKGNLALMDEFRPTRGRPVSLMYVPNGVNLVIHLRPADLWSSDRAAAELRASLTEGVTSWLDGRIRELCRREPSRIAEATFALTLGAIGTQPTSAQVVRLVEPDRMSALLDEFQGKPLAENLKPQVTIAPPNAFVLVDASTFSVSPAETAEELEEALKAPNSYTAENVVDLLKQSDRDRLVTIVAEMQDLRRHVDTLFPESARPSVQAILDWLGDDVEAVSWSLHSRPALYSELILRPRAGVSPRALEAILQKRLDELPARMMGLVKGTRPASKGFRELVGRYPAMLEAVRQATIFRPSGKDLHATTVLPAKAAPNLALGTLLTWDELRRAPASTGTVAGGETKKLSVADKLKKEILAEFNRSPLEQAIKYIGEEIELDFTVDGEALKVSGYTRNMPQTMSLGKVPATRAIKEILSVPNQKDLALFVDEAAGKAVLSTARSSRSRARKNL